MKKAFTFLSIFLFISFNAASQKRWGFANAAGLSKVSGYGAIKTSVLVTLQVSVFAILPLDKKDAFVFMPSLGYLPKGVKFNNILFTDNLGNGIGTGSIKRRVDYLQLTLPGCLKMKWGKNTEGFIGVGPYLAYAISGKEKVNGFSSINNNTAPPNANLDFKAATINRFDAGFNVQVSAVFSKNWFTGLSSDIGLSKVNSAGSIKTHNQSSRVFVGYVF